MLLTPTLVIFIQKYHRWLNIFLKSRIPIKIKLLKLLLSHEKVSNHNEWFHILKKTAKSFHPRTELPANLRTMTSPTFSFNLSLTPPLLAPLLPRCRTHSKLSHNVLSFTRLVPDYLPGSPCRPIKHPRSHGHCLASSAFTMVIMVINIQPPKVNGGTI